MKLADFKESTSINVSQYTDAINALSHAKKACQAILEGRLNLYRGTRAIYSSSNKYHDLPNDDFMLYEFGGRQSPRNSLTGGNMIQSLTKIHPEWINSNFPRRDMSTFCTNSLSNAQAFGKIGLVLPYDSVNNFAIVSDDLNLTSVHTNKFGKHHLLKMQNGVMTFIGGLSQFFKILTDIRNEAKKKGEEYSHMIDALKSAADLSAFTNKQFVKYLSSIPIVQVIDRHHKWLKDIDTNIVYHKWSFDDLRTLDAFYTAYRKSIAGHIFVADNISTSATEKLLDVVHDDLPSNVIIKSTRPATLNITVHNFSDMLTELRTAKEPKEIWFEGPYLIIANSGGIDNTTEAKFSSDILNGKELHVLMKEAIK